MRSGERRPREPWNRISRALSYHGGWSPLSAMRDDCSRRCCQDHREHLHRRSVQRTGSCRGHAACADASWQCRGQLGPRCHHSAPPDPRGLKGVVLTSWVPPAPSRQAVLDCPPKRGAVLCHLGNEGLSALRSAVQNCAAGRRWRIRFTDRSCRRRTRRYLMSSSAWCRGRTCRDPPSRSACGWRYQKGERCRCCTTATNGYPSPVRRYCSATMHPRLAD